MKISDPRLTSALAVAAIALWLGGMLALGAIVAPAVFHIVPAPWSADAMTVVFRRFDSVAMASAAVVLAVEVGRAAARLPIERLDLVRGAVAVLASGLAIVE